MVSHMETLLRFGEAFNREGFAGLRPFLHPDFEFHEPPEQPGATVFHGRDAAMEGFSKWSETWVEQQSVPEGITELPDGRILALTREILVGRDELRTEQPAAQVMTFRDGLLLRWETHWDRDRVLRELGVAEADILRLDQT